jgi:hypothetical protein
LVNRSAHRVKGPANGLFQGLFEGLIGFRDGQSCITQTMQLASLMRHAGQNIGGGQTESLLIVTDQAANPIALILDGLQQTCRQGLVCCGK